MLTKTETHKNIDLSGLNTDLGINKRIHLEQQLHF